MVNISGKKHRHGSVTIAPQDRPSTVQQQEPGMYGQSAQSFPSGPRGDVAVQALRDTIDAVKPDPLLPTKSNRWGS